MNNSEAGGFIRTLRKEKNMTQHHIAQQLGVTEQAVSKWERGLGAPDIALLPRLSEILGVNIEKILAGGVQVNEGDIGNLKKTRFFVCRDCGGILTATSHAEISCCGRKLAPLVPHPSDASHRLDVESAEEEYYITGSHSMTRAHSIRFIACVSQDRVLLVRLYPEQDIEVRIPRIPDSILYYYCTQHGLIEEKIE